jgi:hypothetical protein
MHFGPRARLLTGISVVSVAATLWVLLVFLAPNDPATRVSFDVLEAAVQSGRVREIRIKKRVYTYRLNDASLGAPQEQANGPEPTLAQVRALRPSGPNLVGPKISFEL